jgi:hypothetical protein
VDEIVELEGVYLAFVEAREAIAYMLEERT